MAEARNGGGEVPNSVPVVRKQSTVHAGHLDENGASVTHQRRGRKVIAGAEMGAAGTWAILFSSFRRFLPPFFFLVFAKLSRWG